MQRRYEACPLCGADLGPVWLSEHILDCPERQTVLDELERRAKR